MPSKSTVIIHYHATRLTSATRKSAEPLKAAQSVKNSLDVQQPQWAVAVADLPPAQQVVFTPFMASSY